MKKVKNAFLWKARKRSKTVYKLTKLFILQENYCFVSYSVHDNVWELWRFIREFAIAAMLQNVNPSLKSRFMPEFSRFSRINNFGKSKIKKVTK